MAEVYEVLDLGLVKSQRHPRQYLSNSVETNSDVLVLTVLRDVVVDDLLDNRFDFFGWNELMTRLNNHRKDLSNLVLLMRVQVPQDERIELQDDQVVSSDEAGYESKHQ